ncbi:MAG: putative damage-inducible protein DinB [Candidatus Endobugula sp.]|jgi:uncharacterized damage-inducible protein DinB
MGKMAMSLLSTLHMLTEYKAWANKISYASLLPLPKEQLYKQRQTHFIHIVSTLNHVYVVDDIFKAHLSNATHHYHSRNTYVCPSIEDLYAQQQVMDAWYIAYVQALSEDSVEQLIDFEFVDGGQGRMSKSEIILHVTNHGTYHRGFVSDMMYQIPCVPPANDLTVFLRDVYSAK